MLLAVAGAAMGLFLLHETRGTTFYHDEWTWALHRRGNDAATFLEPHYGHPSMVPIVVFRILFATAGLTHYTPYLAAVIAGHLTCVALVFLYATPRVGPPVALLAAMLILGLGPAAQNILWPFQIGWMLSLSAGIAALLLLDRRDRLGDAGACILLLLSLGSSGVGLPIAVGAAIDVLWRRRWRRGWVVAAPFVLYGVWSLTYQTDQTQRWGQDLLLTPPWVIAAPATVLSSLLGLPRSVTIDGPLQSLQWGIPLLVATAALVIATRRHMRPDVARLVALTSIVLSFWVLTALGRAFFGGPQGGRYVYVGGIFLVLIAVELARGVHVPRRVVAILAGVTALAFTSNLAGFRDAALGLKAASDLTSAELGALQIARPVAARSYVSEGFLFDEVVAGPYFAAAQALGTPGASEARIAAMPERLRRAVDSQLVHVHRAALRPASGAPGAQKAISGKPLGGAVVERRGPCATVVPQGFLAAPATPQGVFELPAAGLRIAADHGPARVGMRRFADGVTPLGAVGTGGAGTLVVRPDNSTRPWQVIVTPTGRATVCGLR